jgi:hypothetical protein
MSMPNVIFEFDNNQLQLKVRQMGRLSLAFKTKYGDIRIEGDSLADFKSIMLEIGVSTIEIENIVKTIISQMEQKEVTFSITAIPISSSKPELTGVIEYGNDGTPHITVSPDRLTAREVIGLLLYTKSPNSISMSELTNLVKDNWKNVEMTQISANLSFMRPYVIKEGTRGSYSYRLSGSGKEWIEHEMLPKLRMKSTKA